MTDYIRHTQSPLGPVTLASDGEALTGLWFDGQRHFGETLCAEPAVRELPVFAQTEQWLSLYFDGKVPDFTPPLSLRGTTFRKRVWALLLCVPYGETVSYGALAQLLGLPGGAARAVGNAVGHNPVSLIVPCHRVLGADGSLGGYAGGSWRKRSLLLLEGVRIP